MSIQTEIEARLRGEFSPLHLEVINESHRHNVPPGSESHFKVTLVSEAFEGRALLARHRLVYACVADEMRGPVHALALHTYTPGQWAQEQGSAPDSPDCRGGMARESAR